MHPLLLSILLTLCGPTPIPTDRMIAYDGLTTQAVGDYYYVSEYCYLANKYAPATVVGNYGMWWFGYVDWYTTPNIVYLNEETLNDTRLGTESERLIWASCVLFHEGWHMELRNYPDNFPRSGIKDHPFIYPRHLDCLTAYHAPLYQTSIVADLVETCRVTGRC